jgi:uncharacterized membrane protein
MLLLILGLILFLGVHSISIVAAGWRERVVGRVGVLPWKVVYGLLSLLGLWLIVIGYGAARQGPDAILVYAPPVGLRHLSLLLMLPVFVLLIAAYLPGRIQRVARHPMLLAVKLWAVAHLLANGMLADLLLFGGFLTWAVVDRISLKRRTRPDVPRLPQRRWNDWVALAAGLALYGAFVVWLHQVLIGVSPLA